MPAAPMLPVPMPLLTLAARSIPRLSQLLAVAWACFQLGSGRIGSDDDGRLDDASMVLALCYP